MSGYVYLFFFQTSIEIVILNLLPSLAVVPPKYSNDFPNLKSGNTAVIKYLCPSPVLLIWSPKVRRSFFSLRPSPQGLLSFCWCLLVSFHHLFTVTCKASLAKSRTHLHSFLHWSLLGDLFGHVDLGVAINTFYRILTGNKWRHHCSYRYCSTVLILQV